MNSSGPGSTSFTSVQFTTLKSESKIQRKPIVPSAIGAAQGSRTKKRRIQRPRKGFASWCASTPATSRTITWEMTVNITVLRSARRKFGLSQASVKLRSPTKSPLSDPAVASVMLR